MRSQPPITGTPPASNAAAGAAQKRSKRWGRVQRAACHLLCQAQAQLLPGLRWRCWANCKNEKGPGHLNNSPLEGLRLAATNFGTWTQWPRTFAKPSATMVKRQQLDWCELENWMEARKVWENDKYQMCGHPQCFWVGFAHEHTVQL